MHEVELGIWQRLLALGQQMLEQFLIAQGTGDAGPTFTTPEGREVAAFAGFAPPMLSVDFWGISFRESGVWNAGRPKDRGRALGRPPATAGKLVLLCVAGLGAGLGRGSPARCRLGGVLDKK